jgi:cytochrome c oxidase cbb3-type subunit I/II
MAFGIIYFLIPRMFNTKLYSKKLATNHFWLGTIGIVLYAVPLYWAGFAQAQMWKAFTPEGQLKFQFLETVTNIIPMYVSRSIGGSLYLTGVLMMVYNVYKTVKGAKFVANEAAEAAPLKPMKLNEKGHRWIETRPMTMLIVSLVVVAIGGIIEMMPTFLIKSNVPTITSVKPYTPLEIHGRDIYIREGCNTCHSQMIRPFRDEVKRYGEYSKAGEFVYDHPFLWGSKRTGPDLARVGGKYPDSWHFNHMYDPQSTSPGSVMPAYPWMLDKSIDTISTAPKITALRRLGVPYEDGYESKANKDLMRQATIIQQNLKLSEIETHKTAEIVALIAYLQRLGTDIKAAPENQAVTSN